MPKALDNFTLSTIIVMHHISIVIFVAILVATHGFTEEEKTKAVDAKPALPTPVIRDTLKDKGQQIYFFNCNTYSHEKQKSACLFLIRFSAG